LFRTGDFIKELYKEEPYAKLEHEDVIYHESQKEQLIEHVNKLTKKNKALTYLNDLHYEKR